MAFPIINRRNLSFDQSIVANVLQSGAFVEHQDVQVHSDKFGAVIEMCQRCVLYKPGPKSASSDFYMRLEGDVLLSFIIKNTITTKQLVEEIQKANPTDTLRCVSVVVSPACNLKLVRQDELVERDEYLLFKNGSTINDTQVPSNMQVVILKPAALQNLFTPQNWRILASKPFEIEFLAVDDENEDEDEEEEVEDDNNLQDDDEDEEEEVEDDNNMQDDD
ncbi:hypothetical protein SAMD00019534_120780 [Acytostelium subglobosum LB1]|uniref:hypothetical protein n=1 Tax=Acytostelium subglobosum LB1 TaxID=1410327 RepID=UPI000644B8FB|nr:hypothetical protein SAMD00019534_120780 [Acytostelium subglobosum LB1]GAM28902.1 hypothetical protein SAMD00019534_120780 [Acytostelium subglobosum LB1]|eukprot:XP_012748087.1 hypothetical protein SAMD00019534_120780 [Acytostelium subglobosum LB1]